jgi:hypothetical protein
MPGNPLNLGSLVGQGRRLVLPASARERHLYVCGGTGVGKSKFLESCIQQDILNWRDSRCGLVLFDPHGLVYQNIIAWLARHGLKRPVVPIDLRRDDWIISYNLLRQRTTGNPAVIVASFVQALAHVWGEAGTNNTPLFAKWATVILLTLFQNGCTVGDAMDLLSRRDLRRSMGAKVTDPMARQAWQFAERNPKEFDNQITSTINRFRRMVGPDIMKATFGQSDVSLDLLTALKEGQIILINLSTEGGQIGEEDANTFATLFLSDLWAAAQARGPEESEKVRPFYVYIDECQKFITPTIADNLDQSRKFGLHLTLANQYPKRLINAGPHGQAMYDSIIANAGNKIVFRLEHPDDAERLATWLFMNTFNTDEIKLKLDSTKVVGYREEMRESRTVGRSVTDATGGGSGGGTNRSDATGEGMSGSQNFRGDDLSADPMASAEGWNSYVVSATGDNENWFATDSHAETESESTTTSTVFIPIMGTETSSVQYRSIEEQKFRAMQTLFDRQDRHYLIRFHEGPKAPLCVKTPTVHPGGTRPERVEKYRESLLEKLPYALPKVEATKRLEEQEEHLVRRIMGEANADEPTSTRRRIR